MRLTLTHMSDLLSLRADTIIDVRAPLKFIARQGRCGMTALPCTETRCLVCSESSARVGAVDRASLELGVSRPEHG
jgi:hypothetical protein